MPRYKGIVYEVDEKPDPTSRTYNWVIHIDGAVRNHGRSSLRASAIQNAKRNIDNALKRGAATLTRMHPDQ